MRFLLAISTFRIAAALESGKWCFAGCELALGYVDFNDTGAGAKKITSCRSRLRATSTYLCIDEYCSKDGRENWLHSANETCQHNSNVFLPPFEIIADYTPEDRARIERLTADDAFGYPTLEGVVIPEKSFFERAFKTLDAAYFEVDVHRAYARVLYHFWALVILVGVANRVICLATRFRLFSSHTTARGNDHILSRPWKHYSSGISILRRYITVPATFNHRCSQPLGWCTVPPRIETLTITAFLALNIVLCTVSYRITHGNLYWPDESIQLWRYISDRTGILSFANFPILWLFGTRNNVLMWTTGWDFGTFNNFHRWIARISTIQAVVHSVGYTVMVYDRGGWPLFGKYLWKRYFWNGELATIFMCALLALSVYGLRRSHYEIFLNTHVILSIIVLVTMYYHAEIFMGEWNVYIFPCLAVWIFDRLLRTLKILSFDPRFWNIQATATYDSSSNLVQLTIPTKHPIWRAASGTYYYIYVLDSFLYAHQNHPFTLAYTSPVQLRHVPSGILSTEPTERDTLLVSPRPPAAPPSLVFLIRPYDGFTSRLAARASLAPASLRVLVEGPYGHTLSLTSYAHILFFAGGTGIVVPLSYLSTLLSDTSTLVHLRIVWAVREHAFLVSVQQEFGALLADERVRFEVHVTQDEAAKDDVFDGAMRGGGVATGRPDIDAVVQEAAQEAGRGRLAVVACGPGGMADEARRASVRVLGRGHCGVNYFEESFKW